MITCVAFTDQQYAHDRFEKAGQFTHVTTQQFEKFMRSETVSRTEGGNHHSLWLFARLASLHGSFCSVCGAVEFDVDYDFDCFRVVSHTMDMLFPNTLECFAPTHIRQPPALPVCSKCNEHILAVTRKLAKKNGVSVWNVTPDEVALSFLERPKWLVERLRKNAANWKRIRFDPRKQRAAA